MDDSTHMCSYNRYIHEGWDNVRLSKKQVANAEEAFFVSLLQQGQLFLFGQLIDKCAWSHGIANKRRMHYMSQHGRYALFCLPQESRGRQDSARQWLVVPRANNPEVAFMDDNNVFLRALWQQPLP